MKITVRLRAHWLAEGVAERIPLCCVLRFALTFGDGHQAMRRGRAYNAHGCFVPCRIFHAAADSPALVALEVDGLS